MPKTPITAKFIRVPVEGWRLPVAPAFDDFLDAKHMVVVELGMQKGNLLPGADADIQIIDPDCEWVYDGRNSFSKTKSSLGVYQDMKLKGKITDTFVRGIHVYQNGEILSENHGGQLIKPIRKD